MWPSFSCFALRCFFVYWVGGITSGTKPFIPYPFSLNMKAFLGLLLAKSNLTDFGMLKKLSIPITPEYVLVSIISPGANILADSTVSTPKASCSQRVASLKPIPIPRPSCPGILISIPSFLLAIVFRASLNCSLHSHVKSPKSWLVLQPLSIRRIKLPVFLNIGIKVSRSISALTIAVYFSQVSST